MKEFIIALCVCLLIFTALREAFVYYKKKTQPILGHVALCKTRFKLLRNSFYILMFSTVFCTEYLSSTRSYVFLSVIFLSSLALYYAQIKISVLKYIEYELSFSKPYDEYSTHVHAVFKTTESKEKLKLNLKGLKTDVMLFTIWLILVFIFSTAPKLYTLFLT